MAVTATFIDAISGTNLNAETPGNRFEGQVEINMGTTYVTGGLTIAALTVGLPLKSITHFQPLCLGPVLDATVNDFAFDKANGKVLFYNSGTQVGNGQDLTAYKLYAFVKGLR